MRASSLLAMLIVTAWLCTCTCAWAQEQALLIARIKDIPDQYVGGEILKTVYARLNVPMELKDMPAKRALAESSAGRIDGEVQRVLDVGNEYPSLLAVRPPINFIEPSAFVKSSRKAKSMAGGWASIRDLKIGIVRGVGSSERGTAGMPRVTPIDTLDQAMQMLEADRIDVVVSDLFSGLVSVRKLGLQETIVALSPPFEKIYIYHFLHEKHAAFVPEVGKVIENMASTGELERLRVTLVRQYLEDIGK